MTDYLTAMGLLAHRRQRRVGAQSDPSELMGGMRMLGARNRNRGTHECLHDEIVTVVSSGLERMICEGCGHLSFRYLAELTGKIDRARFGREVDRLATAR